MTSFNKTLSAARREDGLTLTELLVAMTLLVGILTGAVSLLVSTMRNEPDLSDRSAQIGEARTAIEKMVRELRQGYSVDSAPGTSTQVIFRTYLGRTCAGAASTTQTLCRVTYTCTAATKICTRSVANANGTSPTTPVRLIEGVTNTDIFTAGPSFVGVKLVLPTQDGRGVLTLEDGATLRNATLGL